MTSSQDTNKIIELTQLCEQSLFLSRAKKDRLLQQIPTMTTVSQQYFIGLLTKQKELEKAAITKKIEADPNWIHQLTDLQHHAEHDKLIKAEAAVTKREADLLQQLETEIDSLK